MPETMSPTLTVDLKIRFKSSVRKVQLCRIIKWLLPIALAAIKLLAAHFHKSGP